MSDGVYLIDDEGQPLEMTERPYASEEALQELLEKHPNILPGAEPAEGSPMRWLLVQREAGVPCEEEGSTRWYVDHLFIDRDGVPTLVETKRSEDTRIRREVVGQLLEYAANATLYWPAETIRRQFEDQCSKRNVNPDHELLRFLGDDADPEAYWEQVHRNLRAEKVRLIFVADEIPLELQRIVEFLNGQMESTEVLAVAIKQYEGHERSILVPMIVGQSAASVSRRRETRQWDERSFFDELRRRQGAQDVCIARRIFEWAEDKMPRFTYGKGRTYGSWMPVLDRGETSHWFIALWTYGRVEMQFQYMQARSPFHDEARRREFVRRLNEIPGVVIPDEAIALRPAFPLAVLESEAAMAEFLAVLDWAVAQITSEG